IPDAGRGGGVLCAGLLRDVHVGQEPVQPRLDGSRDLVPILRRRRAAPDLLQRHCV
uniref:Uncharacterized protein n=1 Tax=Globisporangium ultimum (strain ATCC 200006 / CBS 805.95 / DAOM BR144) TaxID=431595 RepID=K3XDB9_GLOUD